MPESHSAIPAIILAGGRESPSFAAAGENPRRGLAEIHGRPMVSYVIEALRAAAEVGEVVLVGGDEFADLAGVALRVPACGSMVENLAAGVRACESREAMLLTSADVPFLTAEAISDFAARCAAGEAELGYAVVPRSANAARFPMMRRTYARLAEGEFTGGNLFYLRRSLAPAVERVLSRVYEARKKPWLLAGLLGPRILWRYARHTITIAEGEARASQLLGGSCRAIITSYAEVGADVDDPADLAVARQLLQPTPASHVSPS